MTVSRVTTFNVNQFSSLKHQQADVLARMVDSDTLLLQETVDLDLTAMAASVAGWGAFQVRNGADDGHANTGVLYRTADGKITDTASTFLVDTKGERARYLTAVKQGGVWKGSAHINPKRFSFGIPTQLAHIGAWVRAHPGPVILGLDRNQCPPGALENATGLKWHGVGIDGFLTNMPVANLKAFPKGFSDHPGVHADVSLPGKHEGGKPVVAPPKKQTALARVIAELRRIMKRSTAKGKEKKAAREKAAIEALTPKKKPATADPLPTTAEAKNFPPIAAARTQSHKGPAAAAGMCLMMVRTCFGISALEPDATSAWQNAKVKHPTTDPTKIPRGWPVFWTGGSHGHGHIAISAGAGKCWSTDIARTGFFDFVDITEIHAAWGLTLVGWTEDINGQQVDIHGGKPA